MTDENLQHKKNKTNVVTEHLQNHKINVNGF